jgi:hypothetical protein
MSHGMCTSDARKAMERPETIILRLDCIYTDRRGMYALIPQPCQFASGVHDGHHDERDNRRA